MFYLETIISKKLRFVYLSVCCFFLFTCPVHAYIDPSVMTYAIQAIAGIAIALGAFFGIYWRKLRKSLSRYIDFSKLQNKSTESDALVYHDPESGRDITPNVSSVLPTDTKPVPASFARDMIPALLLSAATAFMLAIFAPLELFLNNSGDFWFTFKMMIPGLLIMFTGIFAILMILFAFGRLLYRGFYNLLLCAGFTAFTATYLQGNFFSKQLPPLDGTEFDWSAYNPLILRSAVLWGGLCILVVLLVRFVHMRGLKKIIQHVSFFITLILAVTLAVVGITHHDAFNKRSVFISAQGRTSLSKDHNFIILMLDAVDSATARTILEENEELYNQTFADFTYYPNTLGAYPYTRHALPFILTGSWNENQKDFKEFETEAFDASPLISRLREENWLTGFYSNEIQFFYDSDRIFEFENIINSADYMQFTSLRNFIKNELELVWFKYAPYGAKQLINITISEFDELQKSVNQLDPLIFYYSNLEFVDVLNNSGFTVDSEGGCFRFIHLDGAHNPFDITRDLTYTEGQSTSYQEEVEASLNLSALFIEKLKEAESYDNTIVIIMADHGFDVNPVGEHLVMKQNPLLMVKGYDEHHDFTTSEAPLSFADLQIAYQRLMDGVTGQDVFDAKEGDQRNRRYLEYYLNEEFHITEFIQEGYVTDLSTMNETGNYYDLEQ